MSPRPLLALVRKDLQVFLTDRRAVVLSFAAPLLLASFFAVVFGGGAGGGGSESARIGVSVADEDGGESSRAIVEAIEADRALSVAAGRTAEGAREDVLKGTSVVGVVIPAGFGDASARALFRPGDRPVLTILGDPTHAAEVAMVRGILTQHVMQAVTADAFGPRGLRRLEESAAEVDRSAMGPVDKAALKALLESAARWTGRAAARKAEGEAGDVAGAGGGLSMPFEAREEAVTAGNQERRAVANAHAFGGMAVQFLLFGAIEAGVGLLAERQKGLWKRFRAAPVSRPALLLSRGLSATIISLMILGAIFGFGAVAFGIRVQGSPVAFLLVGLTYATTSASFGLLIASLGKTPQAARGLSVLAVLLMVMLGGAWVPTFAFPAWLGKITPLIPTRWAVDGFDDTLARGFSLAEALPTIAALAGFTAAFGLLALARFRWEAV